MADLRNHINRFTLTALFLLMLIPGAYAQEIKRDNSPAIKDKEHFLLQGIRAFNNREFAGAEEAFLKVIELDPKNDAAYYYLSNISLENRDVASGEMLLRKAIENDSTNYWYKDLLARIYLSTKNMDKAIGVYEELMAQFPKKTDIYYNLTNLYINQENTAKAHEILDKIEMVSGKGENIVMARFNLFRMAKEWDKALQYLIDNRTRTSSPRIETIIGDLYAERYQDSLAIMHYKEALKQAPDYVPAMYGEAELYRRKNDYTMFFEKITPVISNPAVESGIKNSYLEQLLQVPGFVQKFMPQLDTLMDGLAKAHPTDSVTCYLASSYFARTGNREKCKELLKSICSHDPENLNNTLQYLIFLYYGDEWELLERESSTYIKQFPEDMDILQMIGISQFRQEKYDGAVEAFEKMKELALRSGDTVNVLSGYSMLGDIYHGAGNAKMSYSNYNKALKINPNYNPVLNNYAYFLALEGKNLKKAYKMSKKTIETEPDNPTYLDTYAWILYLMGDYEGAKEKFKHAMLYGGMESADILDHYAETLYALKDYDLAFIYWEQADKKDKSLNLQEKIKTRKAEMSR